MDGHESYNRKRVLVSVEQNIFAFARAPFDLGDFPPIITIEGPFEVDADQYEF